jgi:hypothetical protein
MNQRLLTSFLLLSAAACTTTAESTRAPSPAHASSAPATLPATWAPLAFLVGNWESPDSGTGARGHFTLQPDLDGKVLVRRNVAEIPQQGRHEDLMVLYREGDAFRAFYVDNEGHDIHYAVVPGDRSATFTSDEVPGRPRFRLTYRQVEDAKLDIIFAIQPPGAPDFKTYLQGTAVRR